MKKLNPTEEEFIDTFSERMTDYMSPASISYKMESIQDELRDVADELGKIIETLDRHYSPTPDDF